MRSLQNSRQVLVGLFLLCCALAASPAGAVGVSVVPAELAVQAPVGESTSVRIKVSNPSSDVAVFEVYPDDFERMITVRPASFTLESEAEQYVAIEITSPESGQFSTLLSVVGRPLAANAFQAGSGVKIPLSITARETSGGFMAAAIAIGTNPWIGIVALGLLAFIGYRRFYQSKPQV